MMMQTDNVNEVRTEYMVFRQVPTYGKTKTEYWDILNNRSGGLLGTIHWYGAWRQYCFFPQPDCVFNATCLTHILGFIARLKTAREKATGALLDGEHRGMP